MSLFVLALIVAAVICGIAWRRPDARAFASGAWQAGKRQAIREFSDAYQFAQQRLLASNPRSYNPRRWASWLLAGIYGTCKTLAAANRVRRAAWRGARDRYQEWKDRQPVDGEVVEEIAVEPDTPVSDPAPPAPDAEPSRPACEDNPSPAPQPDSAPVPDSGTGADQEGQPDMQTEAAGLTSYANAHQQFAVELRGQIGGSESLAASMAGILAEHSDLIGDTAILQDLLNQAAGVADRIAERSIAVANS
ncbi:hypothetical protein [Nonomuraea sp. NPDC049646]|uniref:hypothetical protein n=1 Tax=unclassified Nonomuraea TaxID=2593643 RepID=UPI0037B46ACE